MKFTPNDQYPTPRSLKDDPPPIGAVVLLYHSVFRNWYRSPLSDSDAKRFCGDPDEVWTHWLPMPPDPTKPKDPHLDSYGQYCYHHPNSQYHDEIAFKAGWNAALESVAKLDAQLRGEGCRYPMASAMEKGVKELKAP